MINIGLSLVKDNIFYLGFHRLHAFWYWYGLNLDGRTSLYVYHGFGKLLGCEGVTSQMQFYQAHPMSEVERYGISSSHFDRSCQ